ncbi:MAG: DUF1697 domain-containing protein [Nannocystaceae bacterium]
MARYAAFLRGMNLGKRRITNDELVARFDELGFTKVGAFLASGNVVFAATGTRAAVTKRLERGLEEALGYPVPTFLRAASEVEALARAEPFAAPAQAPKRGKLQVCLLKQAPADAVDEAIAGFASDADWLRRVDADLFWWPQAGVATSELDLRGLERLLGPMTIRTHNTVARMTRKFFAR